MPSSPPDDGRPSPDSSETPLSDLSRQLDDAGFEGQFRAQPDSRIECLTCHETRAAAEYETDGQARFEGESDPADMAMVVTLTCPNCGTAGTLILNYGPDASAEESDVLVALDGPSGGAAPQ